MGKAFYVYMMANRRNGTLYTGVTSDLAKRVLDHKNDVLDGFTIRYQLHLLVFYQQFADEEAAVLYEQQLKKSTRPAKIEFIEKQNPDWADLYDSIR
jgi:putative endonuclease